MEKNKVVVKAVDDISFNIYKGGNLWIGRGNLVVVRPLQVEP